jgi:hypothetical protein
MHSLGDNFHHPPLELARVQFFNDSLIYLSTASNKGFQSFKECATLIKNRLQGFPLELSAEFLDSKLDKVSMDLFPDQDFPDLVPVRVAGDGNCLPRSASMLIFGDQQHHLEMRVRMACELALNKEFYLNNENHKVYEFDTFPYCSMITTYSQHFKPGMDKWFGLQKLSPLMPFVFVQNMAIFFFDICLRGNIILFNSGLIVTVLFSFGYME